MIFILITIKRRGSGPHQSSLLMLFGLPFVIHMSTRTEEVKKKLFTGFYKKYLMLKDNCLFLLGKKAAIRMNYIV